MVVDLNDEDWFEPAKINETENGNRLIITQIENINFKSYANRQVLGPFDKSFTAIVGPNGSGKSNVIDSMLFVFGYRSKKLRSNKLSNLIHSSDNYKNLDFCRVIVHFAIIKDEGGDDFNIIENSEFTVSRTAHRDNSSYYMINEKKVIFKEVSKLLSSHGVDLIYNRFLILQGEVEQISLMKPKAENEDEAGFLEFLEDIIGSSRLKKPIEEYFIKLQEANNFRAEKLNRVKAVQVEKDALEELKNEAVLFLEKENQKSYIQNNLYQINKLSDLKIYEESKIKYDEVNEFYKKEMQKVQDILDEKNKIENELVKLREDYSKIVTKSEEINEKFKEIQRKDEEVRSKIKNTKAKGKKLCTDIENEKNRLTELETEPQKLKEEIEKLEEKKKSLEEELKKAEENLNIAMNSIQEDTKSLQEEKDKQEKVLAELLKDVNVDESELKVVQSKLNILLNSESREKGKLLEYNSKLDILKIDIEKKESLMEVNKTNIPIFKNKIGTIVHTIKQIEQEQNQKIDANMYLAQKLDEAKSSRNANVSRNHVLNFLMNKKNKGELKGIYGRLGDLGGIDKKYDCAISTACGQLDYIVVDTIDNATNCLKSLRENRIGSATFIALDKMEPYIQYCRPLSSTPENIPRLFDLVQVKEECVRPAFYFALRDTLVADNLDIATRIGLGKYSKNGKRWRVVTLDGKLVEISGAMTAGGRPIRGRMGTEAIASDDNNKEINEMQYNLEKVKEEVQNLQFRKKNLENEKSLLEKDLEILNTNIPKFEQELQIYKADLEQTILLIKDQEKLVKNLKPDTQIKEFQQNIEILEKKYNRSKGKSSKVEELVNELKYKIQLVIDKKVGVVKSKVDSLKKELNSINSNITKSNVAEKTNARNLEKCKTRIETLDKEIDEAHEHIDKLKQEMNDFEKLGLELSETYKNSKKDQETKEHEIKEQEIKISKLNKQENSLNMNSVDLKYNLENHLKDLNEKESNVKKWDYKIKELKLHDIENKEVEPFKELTNNALEELNKNFLQKEIQDLDKELSQMKPNFASIKEFYKKEGIYISRIKELNEVTEKRDQLKDSYDKLKSQRLNEFKAGFQIISFKLKEMYRMITMGGDAELEWVDSLDPFTEGINFTVRPNKKSWKQMKNLSGGEKTLSSLSLIFALHYYKPSPLYFMDEIDAALDFKNVSIVANYIKQRTKNTQFIIISLRNDMYELADRLVGIYKTFNCTKSCSLDLKTIQKKEEYENNVK